MIADDNSIQLECQKNGQIECHVECQIERYRMSQYILRSISYIYIIDHIGFEIKCWMECQMEC
jgi:hypothetical protein